MVFIFQVQNMGGSTAIIVRIANYLSLP